jgi:hypothetical protein
MSALDDAEVDVRWPLSSSRTRPAGLLQHAGFLRREIKLDPQSARSWWRRTVQTGGYI